MGALILNADDWGLDDSHTDSIATCFRAGRVTSATGMVYMAGSERAADIARSEDLPIGLHLNLIERFTGDRVPEDVFRRHDQVVRYFEKGGWHRWGFAPGLYPLVAQAITDQLGEFTRLYQTAPTHVDGHQHLHQNLTVLTSTALSSGTKMRATYSFASGEKPLPNRAWRTFVGRIMRARFPGPDHFLSLWMVHPSLDRGGSLERLRRLAPMSLEIGMHPGYASELKLLMSEEWASVIAGQDLRSYRQL
jgi:chitin disaccharide deacetylase